MLFTISSCAPLLALVCVAIASPIPPVGQAIEAQPSRARGGCRMPPELKGTWDFTGYNRSPRVARRFLCSSTGFLTYSADCRMHAGLYWNWFAFDSTLITQMHQGAVVPAGPERPPAAARGCIDHVATRASKDVVNFAVGIRPGALNDRCPSTTGDDHPLSIGVGFELPTWNMNWVKVCH